MPAPAVFLLLLLVGSASGPGQEEPAAPRPARIGVTLAPGASRSIPVPLRRGEFARLEVLQPGARLTLTLLAPDGATVAENANPTEDDEPLPLSVIAPRGGTFTLLLALDPSTTSPVVVTVVLEPPRPASATDPVRIEAERLFAEGQRRRAEGTKEALGAALALDLRTAEKAGQAGDTLREAYARAEAAEVHWLQGELRLAREEGIRSVGLWRTLGRKKQLAAALNDLGAFERDLEETQAALEHYGEALRLGREIGDRRLEAALLHNIGGVYGLLREHRRAIDFLRQALAIKRRLHWHEAVTLDVLGMEYHGLRDFQTSLRYHREVLEMRRRSGDLRGQAITLTNMGWNLDDLGQRPQALALFRQAQALAERVGDRRQEAILLDSTGKTLAALGRADEALDCHQKALALSREIGDPEEQVYALEDSARVLLGLGRPAEALPRIEEALAITEETRTRIAATEHRAAYSAHARERYDLLVDILWTLHQADPTAGHDARALQVSERARARGLLDLLAETRTDLREGVDPALLERERAASAALEQLATEQAAQVSGGKASPEALEEKSQRLAVDLEEIRGLIRAHSPRYAELVFPQPKGLEAIQRSLDGETVLLEYHLAEGRSFVWAVGPTTRVLRELPPRKTLEAEVRRLYRSWSTVGADGARAAREAAVVSRMLLGPVAEQLGARRLVVVADGALHYLPFAALPLPGGGHRLVVDQHEVVALPSASALEILRRQASSRPPAPLAVTVLADPVFDARDPRVSHRSALVASAASPGLLRRSLSESGLAGLERLPATRREAEAILALVPADQGAAALDFQASLSTASSPDLARFRIVHFATHGLLNSRSPDLSGLVLSLVDAEGRPQNGFLRTHDVFGLHLGADLVVLSACQTALGQEVRGEGLVGLTRAFMYAGAPRVLASLWRVRDAATAELMTRFYRGVLVERLTPSAALRTAQLALRRERRFSDPGAWAAFTLLGDWSWPTPGG